MQAFFSAEAGIYVCMDDNAKTFTTLTLLIALCDQALDDLESSDGNSEPLQFLLGATRDAAGDFARTLDPTSARARVVVTAPA
jgi:hypothetical protein